MLKEREGKNGDGQLRGEKTDIRGEANEGMDERGWKEKR